MYQVPFPFISPALNTTALSNKVPAALGRSYVRYQVGESARKPGVVTTAPFDQISLWLALRPRLAVRDSRPDPVARFNKGAIQLGGRW